MSTVREVQGRYRAVFDAARDAMIVYTRDGVVVAANASAGGGRETIKRPTMPFDAIDG